MPAGIADRRVEPRLRASDARPDGRRLGLFACTAIVIGNMVGTGFYLAPGAMAPYGQLAIVAWIVMGAGACCLGLTFARLARIAPATGGPYAYTRMAYGGFAGFLVAWGYWISIWTSLPVIALAFTGSVMHAIPALASRPGAIGITLAAIWFAVLGNLRGVRTAGLGASAATVAKLIPFGAIALLGLVYVRPENLSAFNPSGEPIVAALATLAPITMFAFIGLESATVPADHVDRPGWTIPRATVLGVTTAALLYVLGTTVVLGVVPRDALAGSPTPLADAARVMWGPIGGVITTMAVNISSMGALGGWALLMGQVPMAAARDGVFPAAFARLSSRGVPRRALLVSAALASGLVLIEAAGVSGFTGFYQRVVGLSAAAAVIPYTLCALASGLILVPSSRARRRGGATAVEIVAFAFALFTLFGCGPDAVMHALLLLLAGIPVYVWRRREGVAYSPGRGLGL